MNSDNADTNTGEEDGGRGKAGNGFSGLGKSVMMEGELSVNPFYGILMEYEIKRLGNRL